MKSIRRPLAQISRTRQMRLSSNLLDFANLDPEKISASNPHTVRNFVGGVWKSSSHSISLPDPMNGEQFMKVFEVQQDESSEYISNLKKCTKSGLHNPFKNPDRYLKYGDVTARAAALMKQPEVMDFFSKLIQRVAPKSYKQAWGEVFVTQKFLENFGGDQVRFLARGFSVPGDHYGQMSNGYRWPFGPVTIITPFNFPLEIPMLQLMGALFMGNKVLLKSDSRVSAVMEQALRLLHSCGMPLDDVDFINSDGRVMHHILLAAQPRMTLFTGSSHVAEILARDLRGRIKIEDAGFDWKILGPDVEGHNVDYVAWQSDQDAYGFSGQKCSAQSLLFVHRKWREAGVMDRMKALAARRRLSDLTVGPILTVTNERFRSHVNALLAIPGARLEFGGRLLSETEWGKGHRIPACYGSWEPTAVNVPLSQFLDPKYFSLCSTEIFGAMQVVVDYDDKDLDNVLAVMEGLEAHLTAAVVSNDSDFRLKVLSNTVNGTTYSGIRARTTGAPQNHWFGPAGDPRGAGIGSPEAIKLVWSCHREIINDEASVSSSWTTPPPS